MGTECFAYVLVWYYKSTNDLQKVLRLKLTHEEIEVCLPTNLLDKSYAQNIRENTGKAEEHSLLLIPESTVAELGSTHLYSRHSGS